MALESAFGVEQDWWAFAVALHYLDTGEYPFWSADGKVLHVNATLLNEIQLQMQMLGNAIGVEKFVLG